MAITYAPTTNFGLKDSLPTNDSDKVIRGSEFTTEFTAIQTAFSLAAPNASPTFTGTVTIPTADINGGAIDGTIIGGTTPAAASFTTVSATGNITVGGTVDGRDVAADGTKLDGIEAGADVTDTTNVTAAGALMDSELTSEASVKALDQGVATTDSPTFAGLTTTADVSFDDNDKAIFGAGSDLQIYHDGSNSYIKDNGTGGLILEGTTSTQIKGSSFVILRSLDGENMAVGNANGSFDLYYDNVKKLATTSTGIDVTGTVTADGLTVDGDVSLTASGTERFSINREVSPDIQYKIATNNYHLALEAVGASQGDIKFATGTSSASDRMLIASNGDLSLYEDTGTTPKFFWDASEESLRVPLALYNNSINAFPSTGYAAIYSTGTGGSAPFNEAGHLVLQARSSGALRDIIFATGNGAEKRMRIDSAGNVNIYGTDNRPLAITSFDTVSTGAGWDLDATSANGVVTVSTSGSERMRIDSSGNLLVGTTNTAPSVNNVTGLALLSSGQLQTTADGASAASFNRKTSDGSVINFRKDGTTVGSIGSASSKLTIGSGATGVRFNYASLDTIAPWNVTTNAVTDGATDLGYTNARFKDLYLSGGVYLGGTGAANKLDDYESGTFTPVIIGDSTAGAGTYTRQLGNYRKVGDLVYVQVRVSWTAHTGTGNMRVSGLPFTQLSTTGTEASAAIGLSTVIKTSGYQLLAAGNPSTTQIVLYQNSSTGGSTASVPLDTAAELIISMVYSV